MSDVEYVALWSTGSQIGVTVETRDTSSCNTGEKKSVALSCDVPTDTTQLLAFICKLKKMVESL